VKTLPVPPSPGGAAAPTASGISTAVYGGGGGVGDIGLGSDADTAADDEEELETQRRIRENVAREKKLARARITKIIEAAEGDAVAAAEEREEERRVVAAPKHPMILGAADDDEDRVRVVHPRLAAIEGRLGEVRPVQDAWCYVCDELDTTEPERLAPEARKLLDKIADYNYRKTDKVDAAIRIKAYFDEAIRVPANKSGTVVIPEWTLRGIFIHITKHDNTSLYIVEDLLQTWQTVKQQVELSMYKAPRSLAQRGTYTEYDLTVDKKDLANLQTTCKQFLLPAIGLREKLRQTYAPPNATDAGGGRIKKTVSRGRGGGGSGEMTAPSASAPPSASTSSAGEKIQSRYARADNS
jgi:hypothetical protein